MAFDPAQREDNFCRDRPCTAQKAPSARAGYAASAASEACVAARKMQPIHEYVFLRATDPRRGLAGFMSAPELMQGVAWKTSREVIQLWNNVFNMTPPICRIIWPKFRSRPARRPGQRHSLSRRKNTATGCSAAQCGRATP